MRVVPDGIRCGCGNRGCWEQYASGNALVREARELVAVRHPAWPRGWPTCAGGDPAALRGHDVTRAAREGDPAALELLTDLGTWLGEGAASVAAILDPELIVIGGGVADAGDLLLDPSRAAFRRQLTGRGHRPEAKFALASLGNDAGMIGAAALAAEGIGDGNGGSARQPTSGHRHRHRRHQGRRRPGRRRTARISHRARRDTPHRSTSPSVVEDTIVDVVEELLDGRRRRRGRGRHRRRRVRRRRPRHRGLRPAPVLARRAAARGAAASGCPLPIFVDNDANAAVVGRVDSSAPARGETHLMMVNLGTGIGGGILIDGQVMRGRYGIAGEFGHMQVVPGGHRCECGNRGCWEQYASGNALVREARVADLGQLPVASDLLDAGRGPPRQPHRTADHRGRPRGRPDRRASCSARSATGSASASPTWPRRFDPGTFVIGGGVSAAGDLLLDPARDTFARQLTGRGYRPEARIVAAELGNEAGLIGAADLARVGAHGERGG